MWSQDISQAYLKGAKSIICDVYLRPDPELKLFSSHIPKLLRPIYGSTEIGDIWNATFSKHLRKDLNMQQAITDTSIFFKKVKGKVSGIMLIIASSRKR